MGLKAKIEAIIYAAEEPITLEQITLLVKDIVVAEQAAAAVSDAEALEGDPSGFDAFVEGEALTEGAAEAVPEGEVTEAAPSESQEFCNGEGTEAAADENLGPAPASAETADAVSDATGEAAPADSATVSAPEPTRGKRKKAEASKKELSEEAKIRGRVRAVLEELVAEYDREERGMEIRKIAGGYRMGTKPEHHDVVRAFAKSLKPPIRLSLAALETLAVIAYKQPITVPEISEIRGVESAGVIGTLLDRKLITTAGRKQVIGRPILYRTSKEFLVRFGLNEVSELPSMEEFEKLGSEGQGDLFAEATGSEPAPAPDTEATIESGEEAEVQPATEAPAETVEHVAQETAAETTEDASAAGHE